MTARAEASEDARDRLRSILDTATDAFVGMDANGLVDEWNSTATRLFGWSRDEAIGTPLTELLIPPTMREAHTRGLAAHHESGHGAVLGRTLELPALCRDGSNLTVEVTIWESWSGGERRFNALLRDVAERKAREAELARGVLRDALTGLASRALFDDRVSHALARRVVDRQVAVLVLDIDGFAGINDRHGKVAGDRLLVTVANRFAASVRGGDTLARLGGDEFAVLAEDVRDAGEAEVLADRLLDTLRQPVVVDGRETFVRASVGIALRTPPSADVDAVLAEADIAMHAAKMSRTGDVVVFERGLQSAAGAHLETQAELNRALTNDELRVEFQPYVDPAGAHVGFVALPRWQHPTRGLLCCHDLLPAAAAVGMAAAVDRWLLAEAARQAAWWQAGRARRNELSMTVAVSDQHLTGDLVDDVHDVLASTGLRPEGLMLALPDGAALEPAVRAGLRRLGVRLVQGTSARWTPVGEPLGAAEAGAWLSARLDPRADGPGEQEGHLALPV
jgi:diguanylate cyclase (GGDEF)-like protein/PAS domain S-box-containing protein